MSSVSKTILTAKLETEISELVKMNQDLAYEREKLAYSTLFDDVFNGGLDPRIRQLKDQIEINRKVITDNKKLLLELRAPK